MLLKEVYNQQFLDNLSETIFAIDKKFDRKNFLKNFAQKNWQEKALKQRMRAISIALDESLSQKTYPQKIEILKKAALKISKDKNSGLALIIFPDFVELSLGRHPCVRASESRGSHEFDFDLSMCALEFFTEFGTSEFAVRQFIKANQARALKFFHQWTKSKNHHVRRLASEGCRPRLPWGEALPEFKKDPSAILPILEALKFDDSAYVRKSISNNLNDISKDNPAVVLNLLKKWKKEKVSEPLIKHALRGLLKKGNIEALALIGIKSDANMSKNFNIQTFALQKKAIKNGENLIFDFALENKISGNKIRLEYAVYFLNKNGSHGKKIFQITTKNFEKGLFKFSKKHSLRDLSTRKHNAGKHMISLVVNGFEMRKEEFLLAN
jgi:3-methyladenine DNA glycosylase AlkC